MDFLHEDFLLQNEPARRLYTELTFPEALAGIPRNNNSRQARTMLGEVANRALTPAQHYT